MTLYLSRLRLWRDPPTQALRALIDPEGQAQATDAHHRLLWSLFADSPDRRRDFLWRAEGRGRFLTLSARPPAPAPLFEPPDIKPFDPALAPGDRLAFVLRANATRDRRLPNPKDTGTAKRRRVDIVMDVLHAIPGQRALPDEVLSERPAKRMGLAQQAAEIWIAGQGTRYGFEPVDLTVADYSVMALPGHRGKRQGQPQFGVLDLSGTLSVTDPVAFLAKLGQGFGRAKAFGCGLMLIRRAPS